MNAAQIHTILSHVEMCLLDGSQGELCEAVGILQHSGIESHSKASDAITTVNWLKDGADVEEDEDRLVSMHLINEDFELPFFTFRSMKMSPVPFHGFVFMIARHGDFKWYLEWKLGTGKADQHFLGNSEEEADFIWTIEGAECMRLIVDGEM